MKILLYSQATDSNFAILLNPRSTMLFLILFILIIIAVIWWLKGERALSRNERLYLKRRGYEPPSEVEASAPVSKRHAAR